MIDDSLEVEVVIVPLLDVWLTADLRWSARVGPHIVVVVDAMLLVIIVSLSLRLGGNAS